jgi:hypothetical protein
MTSSLTPGCHRPRRHPGRSHDPAGRGRLGYGLCKRTHGEPLKGTRLLVLPPFTVLGVTDLTSSTRLNPTPAIAA